MNFNQRDRASVLIELAEVANGEREADLLIKGSRLFDVFSGNFFPADLAIYRGYIAFVGTAAQNSRETLELNGCYGAPGLIDAHLHVESTLLMPPELARAVVKHGTTAIVHDPHEIANVFGIEGVQIMLDNAGDLPCDFFATAPSCVPATTMETAGGEISLDDISSLLADDRVAGLGEMMNYPGVISSDPDVYEKLAAAHRSGKVIDGHAPGLTGTDLQVYIGTGISTDHETVTAEEALEKLALGMKIIIRHGSATSSLAELLPLVNQTNCDRFMLGSDDREAGDLLKKGHLNNILKEAVLLGADPALMLKIASYNAAHHYGLPDRGTIAPGKKADLVFFEDLKDFRAALVIKSGRVVASNGITSAIVKSCQVPDWAMNSVKLPRAIDQSAFKLDKPAGKIPVIGVIPGQLITEKLYMDVKSDEAGQVQVDPGSGINKISVIERHGKRGLIAVGLIKGLGLLRGALASSVAHDSHNVIVAGASEYSMAEAVNELARLGGGFVVAGSEGEILAALPLPVAGLMSPEPASVVADKMEHVLREARNLGTDLPQPFLTLAFMALPVIPSLKITDKGLFDVDSFSFI